MIQGTWLTQNPGVLGQTLYSAPQDKLVLVHVTNLGPDNISFAWMDSRLSTRENRDAIGLEASFSCVAGYAKVEGFGAPPNQLQHGTYLIQLPSDVESPTLTWLIKSE